MMFCTAGETFSLSAIEVSTPGPKPLSGLAVGGLPRGTLPGTFAPLPLGWGACCCGGGPGGAIDTRGNFDPPGPCGCAEPGANPLISLPLTPGIPVLRGELLLGVMPFSLPWFTPNLGPGKPDEPSLVTGPRAPGGPFSAAALGLLAPGTRSPEGVCCICWSLGYLIFVVSSIYAEVRSWGSTGAVEGSPARTMICFPKAVMLCPDRGDGEGPIF